MSSINPYESPLNTIEPDDPHSDFVSESIEFRPAETFGLLAMAALIFNVMILALVLALNARLFAAYTGIVSEDYMDEAWVSTQLDRLESLDRANWALFYFTVIFVIGWTYQAYKNLAALGHSQLDAKPIWAALCWFVPLMNLICPYQVVRELWCRSEPLIALTEARRSAPLVLGWWLAWLSMLGIGLLRAYFLTDQWVTQSDMAWWSAKNIIHVTFRFVAALLLLSIIVQINRRQRARYAALRHQAALNA